MQICLFVLFIYRAKESRENDIIWLVFGQSTFLGLFSRGLISRGAYFWDEICVRKGGGLISERYISATITKTKRIRGGGAG